jgi:hypothetical protein
VEASDATKFHQQMHCFHSKFCGLSCEANSSNEKFLSSIYCFTQLVFHVSIVSSLCDG